MHLKLALGASCCTADDQQNRNMASVTLLSSRLQVSGPGKCSFRSKQFVFTFCKIVGKTCE